MSESRAQWLQERTEGIGGSDVAAVLGLSPFRTAFDVWAEKRGILKLQPEPKPGDNEPMYWGTALEPAIASRYAAERKRALWNPELIYRHPEYPMLIGTPDRMVLPLGFLREPASVERGLEIKTASQYKAAEWGEPGSDVIPDYYLVQCLHYMAVTGVPLWDVAVLIGGNDFRVYTIQRDQELEKELMGRLVAWWEKHVVQGVEPPMVGQSVPRWLSERYPKEKLDVAQADAEAEQWAVNYLLFRNAREGLEENEEMAKNNLRRLIGDHAGLRGSTWRATWKLTKDSQRVDWEAVARELANDLALYRGQEYLEHGSAPKPPTAEEVVKGAAAAHTEIRPGSRRFLFTEEGA